MTIDDFYGRCDTCGAPCDDQGCTVDRNHPAAIGSDDIVRTVFTVEVFSRGAYAPRDDDVIDDLTAIHYDITDGECIGHVEQASVEVVPPDKVEEHLLRIGNDGKFFQDGDDWLEALKEGPE